VARRDVTADAAESVSALRCAEATTDLAFHFEHANRLLRQIVRKGQREIEQEAQIVVSPFQESLGKTSPFARITRRSLACSGR